MAATTWRLLAAFILLFVTGILYITALLPMIIG